MTMQRGFVQVRSVVGMAWVAAGCLAVVVVGCGYNGPERAVVSGKVTYRGEPLRIGEIRFIPAKGENLPSCVALILDGRYVADGNGGVAVGTLRVEIDAERRMGLSKRAFQPANPSGGLANKVTLPPKYNVQSELQITVKPGSGRLVQDFSLTD